MADQLSVSLPESLQSGPALPVVFAILAFVAATGTVFALGGGIDHLMWALAGGILTALLVIGAYALGRRYGQPHSHATATAGVTFGVVLLAGVITEVLHASGMVSDIEIAIGLLVAILVALVLVGIVAGIDRKVSA